MDAALTTVSVSYAYTVIAILEAQSFTGYLKLAMVFM